MTKLQYPLCRPQVCLQRAACGPRAACLTCLLYVMCVNNYSPKTQQLLYCIYRTESEREHIKTTRASGLRCSGILSSINRRTAKTSFTPRRHGEITGSLACIATQILNRGSKFSFRVPDEYRGHPERLSPKAVGHTHQFPRLV